MQTLQANKFLSVALLLFIPACAPQLKPVTPAAHLEPIPMRDASRNIPTASFTAEDKNIPIRRKDGVGMFVHPKLNGRDVGWFILDTGATGMTITQRAAEAADLAPVGTTKLVGNRPTTVFECDTFTLGALTLNNLRLAGMDVADAGNIFGSDFAGFCGFDIFSNAIVELDLAGQALNLHDPDSYHSPDDAAKITFHHNLPWVEVSVEGAVTGLMILDTGMDEAMQLFPEAIEQGMLLENRETTATRMATLFSNQSARRGMLREITIAGQTVHDVPAVFTTTENPDIPKPQSGAIGIVGLGLLERFRVVINYQDAWIALRSR